MKDKRKVFNDAIALFIPRRLRSRMQMEAM